MRLYRILALSILLLATVGCARRLDKRECDEACLHHARLWFEETWAEKLAAAPEGERAALMKTKETEWQAIESNPEAPGRGICVDTCSRSGRKEQMDCIRAAKDLATAKACWEEE